MVQVIVRVAPDGTVTQEVRGVVGSGCKAVTAAAETALGGVLTDQRKPEFNQGVSEQQQVGK